MEKLGDLVWSLSGHRITINQSKHLDRTALTCCAYFIFPQVYTLLSISFILNSTATSVNEKKELATKTSKCNEIGVRDFDRRFLVEDWKERVFL